MFNVLGTLNRYKDNYILTLLQMTSHKSFKEPEDISPGEIDEIITLWYEAKQESRKLAEKEKEYKRIINSILDLTGSDAIKGKLLQVERRIQKRRYISRNLVPLDVFDRYSKSQEVSSLYIRELQTRS